MAGEYYTLGEKDSVDSLCYARGLFPEDVWNRPENSELKSLRKDRSVLMKGDVLYLPELVLKHEDAQTEKLHRFRRKAVPAEIGFRLLDERGEPRRNVAYILRIDGERFDGQTDGDGMASFYVPPDAESALLEVPSTGEVFDMGVGRMDPIDTDSGVALRLNNLGFAVETGEDGPDPDSLASAVSSFQKRNALDQTGEIDDQTRAKIKEVAGY